MREPPNISVILPSYARPRELRRCIGALIPQLSQEDELVVVVREGDGDTHDIASHFPMAKMALVSTPGVVTALATGFHHATQEIVAFLDDDAEPSGDWLDKIRHVFLHGRDVGAVGGRVANFSSGRTSNSFFDKGPVAKIGWTGRLTSRLHDVPSSRLIEDVHFLAGSNMAFRRELVSIDQRLNCGMAPGFEIDLAFQVRTKGFRVVYDSDIIISHYTSPRRELPRGDRVQAAYEAAFVYTTVLKNRLGSFRRIVALARSFLLGTREWPGFLLLPIILVRGRTFFQRWRAASRGRVHALLGSRRN